MCIEQVMGRRKEGKLKANTTLATTWDPKFQVARIMLLLFQILCRKHLNINPHIQDYLQVGHPSLVLICILKGVQPALDDECERRSVQELRERACRN